MASKSHREHCLGSGWTAFGALRSRRRPREASWRAASTDWSRTSAISSNGHPKTSCRSNATRSAGLSVSSTTKSHRFKHRSRALNVDTVERLLTDFAVDSHAVRHRFAALERPGQRVHIIDGRARAAGHNGHIDRRKSFRNVAAHESGPRPTSGNGHHPSSRASGYESWRERPGRPGTTGSSDNHKVERDDMVTRQRSERWFLHRVWRRLFPHDLGRAGWVSWWREEPGLRFGDVGAAVR
jgi:hypothetical protein